MVAEFRKRPTLRHLATAVAVALCTLLVLSTVFPIPAGPRFLAIGTSEPVAADTGTVDVSVTEGIGWRRLVTDHWALGTAQATAGAHSSTNYQYGCGMRFQNITIPQGATIDTAHITFEARSTDTGTACKTRISAEDVDDAAVIADDKSAFDTRRANKTAAVVDWDNIASWTADSYYDSPEIKTVIQEIVERVGWVSGNDIVIFWDDWDDRSTHADNMRDAYNYATGDAPELHIEWSSPTPVTPSEWAKRIKLTTNSSLIDSDLAHFPLTAHLKSGNGDTTKVFDELGSNRFKIAIADESDTQYYVEIERWDEDAEEAVLHFGLVDSSLNSTADTDFYLYYDSTQSDNTQYVGDMGEASGVWDGNYKGVWHNTGMRQVEINTSPTYTKYFGADIVLMSNGNLLAHWAASNSTSQMTKNVMQATSTDGGETWSAGEEIWSCNATHGFWSGPMWVDGSTVYQMVYAISSVDFGVDEDSKIYVTKSTDYGANWSSLSYINTGKTYNIPQSVIVKEQTNVGRVVVGYHYYKETDVTPYFASGSMYCDSGFDDGSNWTVSSDEMYVKIGTGTYEPSIVELSDGDLYCMLRTNVTPSGVLYEATSTDDGVNWTTPSTSGVTSRDTPILHRLSWSPNEVMLCLNDDGTNRYPSGTKFSTDDCDTWGSFTKLYDAEPTHKTCLIGSALIHLGGSRYLTTLTQYPDASEQVFWGYFIDYEALHSGVVDSTSNGNDGYFISREPYIVNCGSDSSLDITGNIAAECLVNIDNHNAGGSPDYGYTRIMMRTVDKDEGYSWYLGATVYGLQGYGQADALASYACTISEDTDYYLAVSENSGTVAFFQDATKLGTDTKTAGFLTASEDFHIGINDYNVSQELDGSLTEVRISDTNRADAWMKASYYSVTDGLLSYGTEELCLEITSTPDSYGFGTLEVSGTGQTTINYFTITNTGNCAVDVTIQGTDLTGGDDTWTLADDATPGENIYGLKAGLDDDDDTFDVVVKKSATYNTLVTNLAEDATQDWGLKIWMPTSLSGYDNQQMSATVTLVASEAA